MVADGRYDYLETGSHISIKRNVADILIPSEEDAIPGQLSKHEKKLVYTQVKDGSRLRDFMTAFSWMREAATVNICALCENPSIGLALSEDDARVKCYLADIGLLTCIAFPTKRVLSEVYRQVLLGEADVNEGMLAENLVAQQLVANGHDRYFYSKASKDKSERMEIDFLTVAPYADAAMKPRVTPIEVKSRARYTTLSLNKFKAKFEKRVGAEYVLHPNQSKQEGA